MTAPQPPTIVPSLFPSFAAASARLCGQAAQLLGWSVPQFWAATPSELAAVLTAIIPDTAPPPLAPSAAERAKLMEQFPDG